jgi:hypothetical protein
MNRILHPTGRGWRHLERYVYVERPYDDVWSWLAGHLSTLGERRPEGSRSLELRIRPGGVAVSRPVRLHLGGLVCGDDRARAGLGAEVVDVSLTSFLDDLAGAVLDHVESPARDAPPAPPPPEEGDRAVRRLLLPVDGLAVRPGGATSVYEALSTVPGVVHVSLDPVSGLAAVAHDPAVCRPDRLTAALAEHTPAAARPVTT